MQTFLPDPDFSVSALVLDRQRLGKQRVEVKQILRALTGESGGWVNHPATRMWEGHATSLAIYGMHMVQTWVARNYKDTCAIYFRDVIRREMDDGAPPPWLGDPDFHLSHRSNLLRKAPEHYRPFWPTDPDDLDYVWPRTAHPSS